MAEIADIAMPDVPLSKKKLKRIFDTTRPLDGWERYRALNDAIDEAYEVIDISNREARFALILMSGLNAIIILAATRADLMTALDGRQRVWAFALFGIYAVCAVYFLLQAIEALRPGRFRPAFGGWSHESNDYPQGVRYFEDVIQRDERAHWQAWRDVSVSQLNAELAIQLHSMCRKSNVKRIALRRLYAGLRVMTMLVTGLLVLFVYASWF
jgi:hypothetical protein